jgi:hypothetical protein
VTPAHLARVLLRGVLRVVDEQIGARRERQQRRVHAGVVLRVGRVDNAPAAAVHAIGKHAPRVIELHRRDLGRTFLDALPRDHLLGLDARAHLVEAHREHGRLHLVEEGLACPHHAGLLADDLHLGVAHVDRNEERQTLDVVPVVVREKDRDVERITPREHPVAQVPQPGTCVENDARVPAVELHRAGVSAELRRLGPR